MMYQTFCGRPQGSSSCLKISLRSPQAKLLIGMPRLAESYFCNVGCPVYCRYIGVLSIASIDKCKSADNMYLLLHI